MRMRKRNNLEPRMEAASAVWVREPAALRGNWRSLMPEARELHLEIGCGKGKFGGCRDRHGRSLRERAPRCIHADADAIGRA